MLPLPPIPNIRRRPLRSLLQRLDSYTLWAFNPQPPLALRRSAQDADAADAADRTP